MTVLRPRRCAPDAWRTWLRDGRTLAWKCLPAWGCVWLGWCALRIVILLAVPGDLERVLLVMGFALLAPLAEQLHNHAIDFAMAGITDLRSLAVAWRTPWRAFAGSAPLPALAGSALLTGLAALFSIWLWHHSPPGPAASGVLLGNTWLIIFMAMLPSLTSMSETLCPALRYHLHVSRGTAFAMDRAAWQANPEARFHLGWRLTAAVYLSTLPIALLFPLVELFSAGVMACACADIYGGGYEIKARKPVPTPLRSRMALTNPPIDAPQHIDAGAISWRIVESHWNPTFMPTYAPKAERDASPYTSANTKPVYAGTRYGTRARRGDRRYGALAKALDPALDPVLDPAPAVPARPRTTP